MWQQVPMLPPGTNGVRRAAPPQPSPSASVPDSPRFAAAPAKLTFPVTRKNPTPRRELTITSPDGNLAYMVEPSHPWVKVTADSEDSKRRRRKFIVEVDGGVLEAGINDAVVSIRTPGGAVLEVPVVAELPILR